MLWVCEQPDKWSCISEAQNRLFFSCHTDPSSSLNPARSVLKTCQLHFQTMPPTPALHMFVRLGLGWIISQALPNEIFIFFSAGLDKKSLLFTCKCDIQSSAKHRHQSLSDICWFSTFTFPCLRYPDEAANQRNWKKNATKTQPLIGQK